MVHLCDVREQGGCQREAEFGLLRKGHESFPFVEPTPWKTVCRRHLDPYLDDPKVIIYRLEDDGENIGPSHLSTFCPHVHEQPGFLRATPVMFSRAE